MLLLYMWYGSNGIDYGFFADFFRFAALLLLLLSFCWDVTQQSPSKPHLLVLVRQVADVRVLDLELRQPLQQLEALSQVALCFQAWPHLRMHTQEEAPISASTGHPGSVANVNNNRRPA
eukprot:362201-Chlamydomonas_euryale.AAC.8